MFLKNRWALHHPPVPGRGGKTSFSLKIAFLSLSWTIVIDIRVGQKDLPVVFLSLNQKLFVQFQNKFVCHLLDIKCACRNNFVFSLREFTEIWAKLVKETKLWHWNRPVPATRAFQNSWKCVWKPFTMFWKGTKRREQPQASPFRAENAVLAPNSSLTSSERRCPGILGEASARWRRTSKSHVGRSAGLSKRIWVWNNSRCYADTWFRKD